MQIVHQRASGDCLIAALATVLVISYEESAALIGFELASGVPPEVDKYGIAMVEAVPPLLRAGFAPVYIPSSLGKTKHPLGRRLRFPSPADLRASLKGNRAIVAVTVLCEGEEYGHALAWDGERAVDCSIHRDETREQAPLVEALLLFNARGPLKWHC